MLIYKDGIVADYREVFKNTSFPPSGPSDEFLSSVGAYKVNVFLAHDSRTEKLVSTEPYIEDGWAYTVKVEPKTQEEMDADTESQAAKVRAQRDQLLTECDWVVIKSVETEVPEIEAWKTYRQALRDVPEQEGFPWSVVWPEKP